MIVKYTIIKTVRAVTNCEKNRSSIGISTTAYEKRAYKIILLLAPPLFHVMIKHNRKKKNKKRHYNTHPVNAINVNIPT